MRIVDIEETQWHSGAAHREPGLALKDVFTGEEGGPGNYWLSYIKVAEKYDSPPHKHNFDQVRVMLEGTFNFGDQDQAEGSIGYFSEGTTYTQQARGPSVTLLLQCEGGSHSRYASLNEIRRSVETLKATGADFTGGRFRGQDPISGEIVDKDSYEAIWETVAGERLVYPQGRYLNPVIMEPDAFAYAPVEDAPGVEAKQLGTFNERLTAIWMWRFSPGGQLAYSDPARSLLFVKSGAISINGERMGPKFAAEIAADEGVEIRHEDGVAEILVLRLPR